MMKQVFGALLLLAATAALAHGEFTFVPGDSGETLVVDADVVGTETKSATASTGATGGAGKHLSVLTEGEPEVVSEKTFADAKKERESITGPEVLKGFKPEDLAAKIKKHFSKKDAKKEEEEKEAGEKKEEGEKEEAPVAVPVSKVDEDEKKDKEEDESTKVCFLRQQCCVHIITFLFLPTNNCLLACHYELKN